MKNSVLLKKKLLDAIDFVVKNRDLFLENAECDFTRNRKLTLTDMIKMIISIGAGSLNSELLNYCTKYVPKGSSLRNGVTKSAFIQRQEKIPPEMFYRLFLEFNRRCRDEHTFNGLHLYGIDGSVISYAGYKDDRTYIPDYNINQFHANCMYDLCNKTYIDIELQPQLEQNETRAACNMIRRNSFPEHSIIMMDRGYVGLNLLEYINRTENLDYLIRVKRNYTKDTAELPDEEADIDVTHLYTTSQTCKNKQLYEEGLIRLAKASKWDFEEEFISKMRIVRIRLSSGEYETLVTSLPREKFSPEFLKVLYHLRWNIETSFRELKYDIGMIGFHHKKERSIRRTIIAKLILYNFCMRIAMNTVMKKCRKEQKYEYQFQYSIAFQIGTDYLKDYRKRSNIDPEKLIRKYIVPIRKDRSDQRKMNRQCRIIPFIYRLRAA